MVGDTIERIRDPRQLVHQLVTDRGPLYDNRSPAAKQLHAPGCCYNGECEDRQQLS